MAPWFDQDDPDDSDDNATQERGEKLDEINAYTKSLAYDKRLAEYDILNSCAHVKGLQKAGILDDKEAGVLLAALEHVAEELNHNVFKFKPVDEDIYSAIERRVIDIAGLVGAKLQTGRSRNDQVAADLRLYTKHVIVGIAEGVLQLQEALLDRAITSTEIVIPGFTHLQRAQPVSLAHHLLAHAWALTRDIDRLAETYRRTDVSPLGASALGGSSLPLLPDVVAQELGFAAVFENSMDAVSDRDFFADLLYSMSMLFIHLSRMGEELVLWTSREFDFAHIRDDFTSGSAIFTHKRNLEIAELTRAKAGRVVGYLMGILTSLKGLPLSYNRDLQEGIEPIFDAVEQTVVALAAMNGVYRALDFHVDVMRDKANDPDMAALDFTELLVTKGVAFREAHQIVSELMSQAHERHLPLSELIESHPLLGTEALHLLTPNASIQNRQSPGGSGIDSVNKQLEAMKQRIAADRARLNPNQK